jgi:FkbM family methyltransferase
MRRKIIRHFLKKRGLKIVGEDEGRGPLLVDALGRLKSRQIPFNTIIDVGASDGRWSEQALNFFPSAHCLCVEAQTAHEAGLKAFKAAHPNADYVFCAASDQAGEISFDARDLFGGIAMKTPWGDHCIKVPAQTLDNLVSERKLPPPYLIKLDTHGHELPILAGAARILEQTEVLIVEVYNITGPPPAVPFWDFCREVGKLGYRCLDMFEPHFRPHDELFWQMDLVFARATRPEFSYLGYE